MATETINTAFTFPDGTLIGAYPETAAPEPGSVPSGSATATGTAAGGQVTFTGLADDRGYVAFAVVSGQNRRVRFHTPPAVVVIVGVGGGGAGRYLGEYSAITAGTDVLAHDMVTNLGGLYSRIADGTISGSFNPANWVALPTGGTTLPVINKTSNFSLSSGEAGSRYHATSAGAITVTVPPNSSDAIPIGSVFEVARRGAGAVNVTPGSGVTLNSPSAFRNLSRQFSTASLVKVGTDEWDLQGDLQ